MKNIQNNNTSSQLQLAYPRYFDIDMRYYDGANNHQKFSNRLKLSILIAIRFTIITPRPCELALWHLTPISLGAFK